MILKVKNERYMYCNIKRINHLESLYFQKKEISNHWNYTYNKDINPWDVSYGETRKAWWFCEKGHEWEATINSRTSLNCGCPYCSGRSSWKGFNDLWTTHPT